MTGGKNIKGIEGPGGVRPDDEPWYIICLSSAPSVVFIF